MEEEAGIVEQVEDELNEREKLMKFVKEKRVEYDQKLVNVICDTLKESNLDDVLEEKLPFPNTDAQAVYNLNIFLIKKLLSDVLLHVKNTQYNLSKLNKTDILHNVDLTESLEHYQELIETSFANHVVMFKEACTKGFGDFKKFVDLAVEDRKNKVERFGLANVVINYFSIALGPIKRILLVLENVQEKLHMLNNLSTGHLNDNNHEYIQIVYDLRALVKEWSKEENLLKEKQFDLFDALAQTHLDQNLEDGMKNGIQEFHRVSCEQKFAFLQTQIYNIPDSPPCKNLDKIMVSIDSCLESLTTVSRQMMEFQKQYLPTEPILPVFL